MDPNNKKLILLALVLATVTTILVYLYLNQTNKKLQENLDYAKVFVASGDLANKHIIKGDDIKQVNIARQYVNPDSVLSRENIVGKYVKETILKGEQIMGSRLIDLNQSSLSYNIPEGKRAVSLKVTEEVQVANLVKPGDCIDIIASFEEESKDINGVKIVLSRITKTVLQNITVLAIGQEMIDKADDSAKKDPNVTVTLAVTPEEAERVVYVTNYATIRMALRHVNDTNIITANGIKRTDLAY